MIGLYLKYQMKKLNISVREVSQNEELRNKYIDLTAEIEGVKYPQDYISKQGKCFVFLQDEKIIGGYSFFTKPPFRSIEFARLLKADLGALNKLDEKEDFVEIGGVWMAPDDSTLAFGVLIWADMYKRVSKLKKKYIVYGYSLEKRGLVKFYQKLSPIIIYRGDLNGNDSTSRTHKRVSIEFTTMKNFVRACLKLLYARVIRKAKKYRSIVEIRKNKLQES